jgi:cold shock CspA family protein/HEAT repeat protein
MRSVDGPQAERARLEAASRWRVLGEKWTANLAELRRDGTPVDLVVFTGDLGDWGHPTDYPRSLAFLKQTCAALDVPLERLFVIPGNHDIDRTVQGAAWESLRRDVAKEPHARSRWMAGEDRGALRGDDRRDHILERQRSFWTAVATELGRPELAPGRSPHRRLGYRQAVTLPGLSQPIYMIGLDTAWLAGDVGDSGQLRLTEHQVSLLTTTENGEPLPGFRLALMHHRLADLADGADVRKLLANCVDLLLHGHQHEPAADVLQGPDHQLLVLATGCLYEGDEGHHYPNACQVIDLALDEHARPRNAEVRFRGWSERGMFWGDDALLYESARSGRLQLHRGARGWRFADDGDTKQEHANAQAPGSVGQIDFTTERQRQSRFVGATPYRQYLGWAANNLDADKSQYIQLQLSLAWKPDIETSLPSPILGSAIVLVPEGPLTISLLSKTLDQFVCVGIGGSGKTRTLRFIGSEIAREALAKGDELERIPFLVPAYALVNSSLLQVVQSLLRTVSEAELETIFREGRGVVLVDALNEMSSHDLLAAVGHIKSFILRYPQCGLVVTSRLESYQNQLALPVYEIQSLSNREVQTFLQSHASSYSTGRELYKRVSADRRLIALFRTPLMNKLLCTLPSTIAIPRSIGEMMQALFAGLFERERPKPEAVSQSASELVLSRLARRLTSEPGNLLPERALLKLITEIGAEYGLGITSTVLLSGFLQLGILERDSGDFVRFFHEMALDYYIALDYCDTWNSGNEDAEIPAGSTAIEILAGLVVSADALIQKLVDQDLLLAAKCHATRTQRSAETKRLILEVATSIFQQPEDSTGMGVAALRALAALDEPEATKIFFDALPWFPTLVDAAKTALATFASCGAVEHSLRVLQRGTSEQQQVALHYVAKNHLAQAIPLIIAILETEDSLVTPYAAEALGRIATTSAVDYLRSQSLLSRESRRFPLYLAVEALPPFVSQELLVQLLVDSDVRVRRAAATRVASASSEETKKLFRERINRDDDFIVRSIIAADLLSEPELSHIEIVRAVFAVPPVLDAIIPVQIIFRFLSGLTPVGLSEALLQALCCEHKAVQSMVSQRVLRLSNQLAEDAFELVDLTDHSITAGPKIALVSAAIQGGKNVEKALVAAFADGVPVSVREAALKSVMSFAPHLLELALGKVINDSAPLILSYAPRILEMIPHMLSDSLVVRLLENESSDARRAVFKLFAGPLISDELLLMLITDRRPDVRLAVVGTLVNRKHKFNISLVHEMILSDTRGLRRYGFRILSAISHSRSDQVGIIKVWNDQRGFGFIRRPHSGGNVWPDVFFHISNITPPYLPQASDLVSFELTQDYKGNATAAYVSLFSRHEKSQGSA